jgi:hypothetical protein
VPVRPNPLPQWTAAGSPAARVSRIVPHAAPNLFRGWRGEVPYGQVNFLEAVPFEAVRVVGTLVEVDQQPHTAA